MKYRDSLYLYQFSLPAVSLVQDNLYKEKICKTCTRPLQYLLSTPGVKEKQYLYRDLRFDQQKDMKHIFIKYQLASSSQQGHAINITFFFTEASLEQRIKVVMANTRWLLWLSRIRNQSILESNLYVVSSFDLAVTLFFV